MTDDRDAGLKARARRAYETGRLWHALRRALWLLPLAAVSRLGCCADPVAVIVCGAALFTAVTLFLWRGGDYARGVGPGILAGVAPLLLPVVVQTSGHLCAGGRCLFYPGACLAGGLAGGLALAFLAPRPVAGNGVAFMAACLVAGLTGAIGCLLYGVIGFGGMAVGLLLGAVPALVARRA
jgi:hypothetical protein